MFGDEQFANMLLVGAVFQAGGIALPASVVEQAIRLNGARVDSNLAAFRDGRGILARPDGTEAVRENGPADLDGLVVHRAAEPTAYQDERYASEFSAFVEQVRSREAAASPTAPCCPKPSPGTRSSAWPTRTGTRSPGTKRSARPSLPWPERTFTDTRDCRRPGLLSSAGSVRYEYGRALGHAHDAVRRTG
ncbi:hypothetical protein [Saccharopolyspora pogona]